MIDGDHIVEQTGYIQPMQILAGTLLLQLLSDPNNAHLLGLALTTQERLSADCPANTRKLFLQKLQERF